MQNLFVDAISLSQKKCRIPIACKLAYATDENFLGRIVDGYHPKITNLCLLSPKAAHALCQVQNELLTKNLGLLVRDSYRPLRAVRDFGKWMQWPHESEHERRRKAIHYPQLDKSHLCKLGYIAAGVSNHCYGDTVDLVLIDPETQILIDMGVCFDFFGEKAYANAPAALIGEEAYHYRKVLNEAMVKHQFIPYEKEFWHFTFALREIPTPQDFTYHEFINTLNNNEINP